MQLKIGEVLETINRYDENISRDFETVHCLLKNVNRPAKDVHDLLTAALISADGTFSIVDDSDEAITFKGFAVNAVRAWNDVNREILVEFSKQVEFEPHTNPYGISDKLLADIEQGTVDKIATEVSGNVVATEDEGQEV